LKYAVIFVNVRGSKHADFLSHRSTC